jgi:CTP:molybdopterin cytidylyltransferase MocA
MAVRWYGTMPDAVAVILAGGRTKGSLAEASGQPHRALLRAGGKTLLEHAIAALADSHHVRQTVVVAPAECRDLVERAGAAFDWLPAGDTMLENLIAGATALGDSPDLVVAFAGDSPLVTGEMVDHVVETALEKGDALCYPIVERSVCERAYPGVRRTYAKLSEGQFTGGNVMVVSRRLLLANRETVENAYAARKSPLRLAGMLGWSLILRLPLGLVPIAEAERRAARILGFPVSAWITEEAGLAVDVDKLDDLRLMERLLGPGT